MKSITNLNFLYEELKPYRSYLTSKLKLSIASDIGIALHIDGLSLYDRPIKVIQLEGNPVKILWDYININVFLEDNSKYISLKIYKDSTLIMEVLL